jgi:hypothetical protein
MKRMLLACLSAALMVPAVASAKKPYSKGQILFAAGSSAGDCDVTASDLEINVTGATKVVWELVDQGCGQKLKVAVGGFRRGQYYYPLVKGCKGELGVSNTLKCDLNIDCLGVNDSYTFDVCVNGQAIFDPELRIKGGGRGLDDGSNPAAAKCDPFKKKDDGEKDCIDSSM